MIDITTSINPQKVTCDLPVQREFTELIGDFALPVLLPDQQFGVQ